MKDTTFHYLIAVMRYGYGNNSRAARHIGIDPRTFRAFRGRAVLLQKASLFRCILSARVVHPVKNGLDLHVFRIQRKSWKMQRITRNFRLREERCLQSSVQ